MKLTTAMGNAAMQAAIDAGLIKDGVTAAQRAQLDTVLQAALDAHPVLRLGPSLIFAGSDLEAFKAVPGEDVQGILANANIKIVLAGAPR